MCIALLVLVVIIINRWEDYPSSCVSNGVRMMYLSYFLVIAALGNMLLQYVNSWNWVLQFGCREKGGRVDFFCS